MRTNQPIVAAGWVLTILTAWPLTACREHRYVPPAGPAAPAETATPPAAAATPAPSAASAAPETAASGSLSTAIPALLAVRPAADALKPTSSVSELLGPAARPLAARRPVRGPAPRLTAADNARLSVTSLGRTELGYIAAVDPFPDATFPKVDPLSGKPVDAVLAGPAFTTRGLGAGFDYYRYVTFYDVKTRKERITALPSQREECHDGFQMFANFSYSYSVTTTLSAGITSAQGLGMGLSGWNASYSKSFNKSYSATRNLNARGGIIAEHVPYFIKRDWVGRTYIETLDSRTGKRELIVKEQAPSSWVADRSADLATPWWKDVLFPALRRKRYPGDYFVRDADWMLQVDRIPIKTCADGFVPTGKAGSSAAAYLMPGSPAPYFTSGSASSTAASAASAARGGH